MTNKSYVSQAKKKAHEALERAVYSFGPIVPAADRLAVLQAAHAAIDALADAIGKPEAAATSCGHPLACFTDGCLDPECPAESECGKPKAVCQWCKSVEDAERISNHIGKERDEALASLARRGRGHARNCKCRGPRRTNYANMPNTVEPAYTDPRCQPLSETVRAGLLTLVNQQAEDEGLWFRAQTAPEGYLQQELRKLHAAVESGLAEEKSIRKLDLGQHPSGDDPFDGQD